MANYATLIAAIQAVIKANGNNEITGPILQSSLLSMIASLGADYQFAGFATPATNPGTPDQNVFYIACRPGVYTNFGGIELRNGRVGLLTYNGTWSILGNRIAFGISSLDASILSSLENIGGLFQPNMVASISANDEFTGVFDSTTYDCVFAPIRKGSIAIHVQNNVPIRYIFFSKISTDAGDYISNNTTGVIPSGAKFVIINLAKSDNVNGYDNLFIDQTNSFTSEKGTSEYLFRDTLGKINPLIDTQKDIDISLLTLQAGWLGSSGNWGNLTASGTHVTISRESYSKLYIKANSARATFFLFATKIYGEPLKTGESYLGTLCEGETGRRTVAANTDATIDIPNDCRFIVIGMQSASGAGTDYSPAKVILGEAGSLNTEMAKVDVDLYSAGGNQDIDLSGETIHSGWLATSQIYIGSGGTHITLTPSGYKKISITGGTLGSFFAFLKSTFVEPSVSTSYITDLCTGETGRRAVAAGQTEVFDIPEDCAYIVIGMDSSTGYSKYAPFAVSLFTSPGILERLDTLERDSKAINPTIKLLSIGNSFSQDSLAYVPVLLESIIPGVDVTIGVLYKGSCSLQMHWENRTDPAYYGFYVWETKNRKWVDLGSKGLDFGLEYTDWDIVTLQQNSANSTDYNTYQPYLDDLIGYIAGKTHNCQMGWLLTHAYANGNSWLTSRNMTSADMAELIRACAERVMKETATCLLFPYGTAIQNARTNGTLDAIGDGGEMCYSDKVHLQEGLGCQVAAYANALVLLKLLTPRGINGNEIRINDDFIEEYAVPGPHGDAEGSDDSNSILAQKAAILAVKYPFDLSNV